MLDVSIHQPSNTIKTYVCVDLLSLFSLISAIIYTHYRRISEVCHRTEMEDKEPGDRTVRNDRHIYANIEHIKKFCFERLQHSIKEINRWKFVRPKTS